MKRSILIHCIAYTLVGASCFWGGAVTRDYLVTREAKLTRQRPLRFLNQPAPAIESTTVDGAPWRLADLRGKVVLIEGWATYCGPCIAHLPIAKGLYERFKDRPDFAYVGASLDGEADKVKAFREKHGLPWTLLVETGRDFDSAAAKALDVKRIPFTCIIDKQGIVRRYDERSTTGYGGPAEELIARLLAQ